jgi:chitinase
VVLLLLPLNVSRAQGTVPTFRHTAGSASYLLPGGDPGKGVATTIPTVLVPIALSFEAGGTAGQKARGTAGQKARGTAGQPFVMNAEPDVPGVLRSPVFANFAFPSGGATQYADAMLRATFPAASGWHTYLGKPEVKQVKITVPVGFGYILTSKQSGRALAVADIEFLQRELFKLIPRQEGKLVIAVTHNTTYYTEGDATLCCSWGTHGVDSATGNSFVLGSYLRDAPAVVEDSDVQPLTQQLAEFVNDPLHDPLLHGRNTAPGNTFPGWTRPAGQPVGQAVGQPVGRGGCGGAGVASAYFLLEPTDANPKNNLPSSKAFVAHVRDATYHLQNVALLPWYTTAWDSGGNPGGAFSFPDPQALPTASTPCAGRGARAAAGGAAAPAGGAALPATLPATLTRQASPNGHQLIGYWAGYGAAGSTFPLREISPQWDVILVAFATPDRNAPEGTMQFQTPAGLDTEQFKTDIRYLKSQGRKVMISLGGGGQHFTLADPKRVPNFVSSVARIVANYGFDGIDVDFESPSLSIDPGDTDFQHPTTPSIVNLISALRQLHDRFGPGFMISLVPEGTQIPSGYPSYGGQFGSYLPILYAIRDILSFVDVQDYNTPPLEGLDGEIYQPGSVDYHAAVTELLLHGFAVGGDSRRFFPPLPANKVAVGFLTGDTTPGLVSQAMSYLITGHAPNETRYKLRDPAGYPAMIGAMFWTIDADRRGGYNFSNVVGPQLHGYPADSSRQVGKQ